MLIITIRWVKSLGKFQIDWTFLLVAVLAALPGLFMLTNYPFVSVGDELRDGGLNAYEIATGLTKNIFGYGRYDAHGLIIPTLTAGFYHLLGSSVLVYRLPAAIAGILDATLLYILLTRLTKNKLASGIGALSLAYLPLHLYYSRTEIVVILSSLLSTVLLVAFFVLFKRKFSSTIDFAFVGALLGFTFNFHASIKAIALIYLILITFLAFSHKTKLLILYVFIFVGFGPRLFFSLDPKVFFHTSRASTFAHKDVVTDYVKSLMVWFTEPTGEYYPDHKPIYTLPISILMAAGIFTGITRKQKYLVFVVIAFLLAHITNSALTDMLNAPHRLSPLFPIGSLFVGVGLATFKRFSYLLNFCLLILLIYRATMFFVQQSANKGKYLRDYLSMNTIYTIKKHPALSKLSSLKFIVSPSNYREFTYLHYQEQYRFFFPNKQVSVIPNKSLSDNELFITSPDVKYLGIKQTINCSGKEYNCPLGYNGNILINY